MSKRYTAEQNSVWLAELPKKNVAVKVILKSDSGNVLLVKPDYKDTWQMPGGGVEPHEDPKVAAVRETKEETGLEIDVNDLRIVDCIFKQDEEYLLLMFEYQKTCDENADYSVADEEIEGYKFVPQDKVAALIPKYYHEFWDKYITST